MPGPADREFCHVPYAAPVSASVFGLLKNLHRCCCRTCAGGEERKLGDEVETAMFVAAMDVVRGDVVPASADSCPHTCDVQFRAGQTLVPDMHFGALLGGFQKEFCDGIPAEGGLKAKIQALFDRPFQRLTPWRQAAPLASACVRPGFFSLMARAASYGLKYSPPC